MVLDLLQKASKLGFSPEEIAELDRIYSVSSVITPCADTGQFNISGEQSK